MNQRIIIHPTSSWYLNGEPKKENKRAISSWRRNSDDVDKLDGVLWLLLLLLLFLLFPLPLQFPVVYLPFPPLLFLCLLPLWRKGSRSKIFLSIHQTVKILYWRPVMMKTMTFLTTSAMIIHWLVVEIIIKSIWSWNHDRICFNPPEFYRRVIHANFCLPNLLRSVL